MDERVLRQRVGVVVLAAALITAFLVARFGDLPLPGAGTYTIYARFPYAPGVTEGTPVRKSGVQIGRVTSVELLKPAGVRITTEINNGIPIVDTETCRISSASVLGDAIIEFVPSRLDLPPGNLLEDGTEIVNGVVGGNPLDVLVSLETDMRGALGSISRAGTEVEVVARNLNTAMGNNEDQIPRLAQKAERALDQFSQAMNSINEVFGDEQMRAGLKQTLRDVPAFMQEARGTLRKADEAFDGFKSVSDRASRNLENLENFTKPLGERGPQLVDNLDGSLANINELLEQLVVLTEGLNSRQGTLGRILHDDVLYRRLDNTLANAEEITSKLRPILDDIRIFSDKIARDPRQLGLKGALDRRPTGVGTKSPLLPHDEPPISLDYGGWDTGVLPSH
ncbi:MAG: MlaD family protein [Planctomycetaceae bacterium]|nr:MlaD family protein [Planctomycetaceae bacterium]